MERTDYLRGLRRRWPVLVLAIAVGAVAGWFVKPPAEPEEAPRYEAGTAILGSPDPAVTNLSTLSALASLGEVPRRVANVLDYAGDPLDLASQITTSADQGTGILWVRAVAGSPERAELLADTFARQLVKWVAQERSQASVAEAERLRTQLDRTAQAITVLEAEIRRASVDEVLLLTAERDAMIRSYGFLTEQYDRVVSSPAAPPIYVLQRGRASATPVDPRGLLSSLTPTTGSIIGGVLGLLAGLALALLLERFDSRIRTKTMAERSFGLPVLAEIPPLSRRNRRRAIVTSDGRVSSGVTPFRLLGAVLAQAGGSNTTRLGGDEPGSSSAQTILVTSPAPSDDKSRVAGSLAAALAESGKRVLLLSCDLRRSRMHRFFDVANDDGLSDALRSGNGTTELKAVAKSTGLPNLKVVPSGTATGSPGALLSSDQMARALHEARGAADVVLLDAPAVLAEGDAVSLFDEADSVLVVAETGETTVEEAQRTTEILERLDVPVAGVALNGSSG